MNITAILASQRKLTNTLRVSVGGGSATSRLTRSVVQGGDNFLTQ